MFSCHFEGRHRMWVEHPIFLKSAVANLRQSTSYTVQIDAHQPGQARGTSREPIVN
ncbi:conserved hypothetical protein [Thiomonas arsenitoxydans]|uniref:Uncharacterized protein n=1 Tax=Thiomonas arsenitoxydans (strain DSM 22701 / CIP 110005 / 3As) TaxID=426114 RepID=D6CND2_THIA3|nr:hypothetical protein THI_3472 [Thiomonas arsenitoxydans]CQR37132.1 conserved hypothetical protein [Thiomonas arsenitoxydans]CQR38250.1 conserved hypothetical protein [Thiomonas arsenitoxydans]CQR40360.1 conserved hypothetical protein [Thiomonas arsenitoxydans]CQR40428.1 conserved hypothetical protein [Thiomonas arsenitoxydans]